MDPERFARLKREFQDLLTAAPEQRRVAVERLRREDQTLSVELAAWLALEEGRAGDWLERPALLADALVEGTDPADPPEPAPPERIGVWRLDGEIGRGGMGAVYRAHRDDDAFAQTVAIKLVRSELSSEMLRRRFVAERRILAGLAHPNIAQLIDGGTTPDGVPYLVLEYVAGEPIDRYCERRALSREERLRLFLVVCGAVAFAHQNLVLHRDIKPANVLVDEAGRPKLLDFGIAKLLAPGEGHEDWTALGIGRPLTREWASPEQLRGDPLTTASDVYSLGVLLHVLLTGTRPPRGEDEPLTTRELRGDLQRVVARALAPDVADRYGTVADLAADLERYLGGRAVSAHPPSVRYRAGKFVRRHRAGVAAATLALLSLAIGGGVALWQARVAARERERPQPVVRYVTYSGHDSAPAVSPGGDAIAFTSRRDGRQRIWLARIATGDEAPLTTGEDDHARFSPDGREILFVRRGREGPSLYSVPSGGGAPRRRIAGALFGDFAPDGRSVAFVRQLHGPEGAVAALFVANRDGRGERELARFGGGTVSPPRWSPDGRTIAVSGTPLGAGQRAVIALLDAPTSRRRTVSPEGSAPRGLGWAGPNRLVYAQPESVLGWVTGTSSRLVVHDLESSAARSVLSNPTSIATLDVGRPGQLVFTTSSFRVNLREVPLPGVAPASEAHWLTRGHGSDRQPRYSPDGEWVVYSSNRGSHLDLWAVSTASGATRQLTRDAALDWDPVFTADGRLLWSSDRSGHFEIWEAAADGSGARQLTRDGVDAQNPTPTSDGWVLYASSNPASRGILRVRRDGSRPALLVPGDVFLPEVSPDGRHVAYLDLGAEGPTLRVARVADGVRVPFALPLPLSDPAADPDAGRCRWLPDGRALAFIGRAEDGTYAVYSVPFTAGAPAQPLAVRRLALEPGFAAESFGVSPDGRRLTVGYWERTSNLMMAEGVAGLDR